MLGIIEKARDSEFWKRVREDSAYEPIRDYLLKRWREEGSEELPILPFSDFRLFFTTGNRTVYEKKYFARRRALNLAALLSMIYPSEEKYLVRLEDVIFSVCDEYTWCLPAHQPTVTEPLPDHLDLFATETGYALSEIDAILQDRLSPLVRARIRCEVERRIIASYTDGRHYGWETSQANWAAVCIGGVAASVLYLRPDLFDSLRPRFEATVESFLSGFGDDGICLEGVGYWSYGFGFFLTFADLVRDHTSGGLDYLCRPKVAEIACFLQKIFLTERCSVSFSDGSREASFNLGILHYLHDRFGDRVELLEDESISLADGCARWCLDLRRILWFSPDKKPAQRSASSVYYGKDAEWFIKKTPSLSFAAKGGDNGEPHNHNDVGGFILARNGEQIFADLGSGVYTRQYFRAETRYNHINCSSLGHSVPYFGDGVQQAGKEFSARDAEADDSVFSLEIADAYRIDGLRSLRRSFEVAENAVTLRDLFDADPTLPITERFLLSVRPTFDKEGIRIGDFRVTLGDPTLKVNLIELPFSDHKGQTSWISDFWLMDIALSPGTAEFSMKVELKSE